ncbi:MAG: PDZ domain-containing protein [Pirellulaceae bacterium]
MNLPLFRLGALGTLTAVLLVSGAVWCWAQAPGPPRYPTPQYPAPQYQAPQYPSGQAGAAPAGPQVIHIHHHYHNLSSNSAELASAYAPGMAWNYGFQPGTGNIVRPWTQNWGHLGFTGYLGQQGQYTGLIVDTLTPDSPAAQMGLVQGDFILAINGRKVNDYKQVTILFDESVDKPKAALSLRVWNPATGRIATLKADLVSDDGDDGDVGSDGVPAQ